MYKQGLGNVFKLRNLLVVICDKIRIKFICMIQLLNREILYL